MTDSDKIIEKIEGNWQLYTSLVSKIKDDDVRDSLLKLCEEVKDRLAAAPASTKIDYVGAYPGGLVQHSLNILKLAKNLNKVFNAKVDIDSLIVICLFHDIGKIGNETKDYYIEQESDWHKRKGIMYEINPDIEKMPVVHRSLWWLNKAKCPLKEQEVAAISSLANMSSMYAYELFSVPLINVILQTATRVACITGAGKTNVLE